MSPHQSQDLHHNSSFLRDIGDFLDQLERNALEQAIHAKPDDDSIRRHALDEVRIIRSVRQKLREIARPEFLPSSADILNAPPPHEVKRQPFSVA